jgi:hypothetical protein
MQTPRLRKFAKEISEKILRSLQKCAILQNAHCNIYEQKNETLSASSKKWN